MAPRFIYIVGVSENPVKIGIADDVQRRLIALQVGCPDPLKVHHQIAVPAFLAPAIEAAAHQKFRRKHRHGEWFNVDADAARDAVLTISERLRTDGHEQAVRSGDILDELEVEFRLHRWVREGVALYRNLHSQMAERKHVQRINALILKDAGMAAYTVFRMVIVEKKSLPGALWQEPGALRNAHAALAKALNVLAAYYTSRRDDETAASSLSFIRQTA